MMRVFRLLGLVVGLSCVFYSAEGYSQSPRGGDSQGEVLAPSSSDAEEAEPTPDAAPAEVDESEDEERAPSASEMLRGGPDVREEQQDERRADEDTSIFTERGEAPPWTLSDEELRATGWEFSEGTFRRGNPLAGAAALTLGLPLHGIGHLLVDDTDSMFKLILSEVAALGVIGLGTVIRGIGRSSVASTSVGTTFQVGGMSMLAAGWLADVVGSFKGTTVPLPRNALELPGTSVDLYYTLLFSSIADIGSVGVASGRFVGRRFAFFPEVQYGPNAQYLRYGARFELRNPVGEFRDTFWTVWGQFYEEQVGRDGWGRDVAALGLGLSYDIGGLIPHVAGLVWQLRLGVGAQTYFYETQGNRRFLGRNVRYFIPVETQIAMNINRGLNIALGYRHRPDELAGTLRRNGGVLTQRFTVLPIERLGIALHFEEGEFLRMWIGIRYYFTATEL